jgi:hypothetical protein
MAEYDRDRLMSLFPELHWQSSTVVRCTAETAAEGKFIKRAGSAPRYGHVCIVCEPAFSLSVRLEHQWPDEVAADEQAALDRALLAGLVEGLTAEEYPAGLCKVTSVKVSYVPTRTTEQAVRLAARLSVQSALGRNTWKLHTRPRGSAPHGEEPA